MERERIGTVFFAQDRVEGYCYFGFSRFSLGRTNGQCMETH